MKTPALYTILYQDESLIAVNKASGVNVTSDRWTPSSERLDKIIARDLGLERLFTVHRIDQGCSGVVVFAKTSESHRELSRAFEERGVGKTYIAIVHGRPVWKEYCCELPLAADATKNHRTIVEKFRGKKSVTRFRLTGGAGHYSVIEASPQTGRQHQIRVHLASLGHPLVCDELYGSVKPVYLSSFKPGWRGDHFEERPLLARLGLHAQTLTLPRFSLTAPLQRDMAALIHQIEKNTKRQDNYDEKQQQSGI